MRVRNARRPEAQARRLLAAYPWRVREERGAEIVGTVLDTLPPGAGHLPLATAIDLVRGGLRTRLQRRPPFRARLAYRFGFRIHPRWIGWVYDDLEDPRYGLHARLRALASVAIGVTVAAVSGALMTGHGYLDVLMSMAFPMGFLCAVMVSTPWRVERDRRRARSRHALVPGGSHPGMVWVRLRSGDREKVWPVERSWASQWPEVELWTPETEARH